MTLGATAGVALASLGAVKKLLEPASIPIPNILNTGGRLTKQQSDKFIKLACDNAGVWKDDWFIVHVKADDKIIYSSDPVTFQEELL